MARPDQVERALKIVYKEAMNKLRGKELELLIVILPDNNGCLYGQYFSPSSGLGSVCSCIEFIEFDTYTIYWSTS